MSLHHIHSVINPTTRRSPIISHTPRILLPLNPTSFPSLCLKNQTRNMSKPCINFLITQPIGSPSPLDIPIPIPVRNTPSLSDFFSVFSSLHSILPLATKKTKTMEDSRGIRRTTDLSNALNDESRDSTLPHLPRPHLPPLPPPSPHLSHKNLFTA